MIHPNPDSSTWFSEHVVDIKVTDSNYDIKRVNMLEEILSLHNQYTVAIMRHVTDNSTPLNDAITDIFTRKQALQVMVDLYEDTYNTILAIEL